MKTELSPQAALKALDAANKRRSADAKAGNLTIAQAPAASVAKAPKAPATPKPARKPAATAFSEVDPNMKRTTIYLDDDVKKAFKIWCVTHDTTMTEWIAKTIVQHLKKKGWKVSIKT
ncbi:hypothetical protein [Corynebacterium spheniscorum]|uniref:Uncharacterized protein n=1 Tax=Corynebacterium spheniscorum TaxID=185761 RepID=A0A1I2VI82_9CORY|nr:hypothetical protein [Corynebacterium spheniscorum]KAA8722273.1 hypothetical protein F4V56_04810 [Corynebacterium spheniscorum]SFG87186.1 hypothetical protein SAMN05660282_02216 [Corynebacterium spheniscorum]